MIHRVIVAFMLCIFLGGTWAQNLPLQHDHSEKVVDGATNPELIPDVTAYRLWLVAVSTLPNSTEEEKTAQKAHLARLGLKNSGPDYYALQTILSEFKTQYVSLINRYNESATAALAKGVQPDQALFLQQRDDLVSATRIAITSRLSSGGAALVAAHVQSQKQRMQLHMAKEVQ